MTGFIIFIVCLFLVMGGLALAISSGGFHSKYFNIHEDISKYGDPVKYYTVMGKWPRSLITYYTTYSLEDAQNWCRKADIEMDKVKS